MNDSFRFFLSTWPCLDSIFLCCDEYHVCSYAVPYRFLLLKLKLVENLKTGWDMMGPVHVVYRFYFVQHCSHLQLYTLARIFAENARTFDLGKNFGGQLGGCGYASFDLFLWKNESIHRPKN